jgi:hypothetical protein
MSNPTPTLPSMPKQAKRRGPGRPPNPEGKATVTRALSIDKDIDRWVESHTEGERGERSRFYNRHMRKAMERERRKR